MPTWQERVYAPDSYSGFTATAKMFDEIILACTSVSLLACVAALAFIVVNRASPVIRAASPWFCAIVVLGCTLLLLSNYGLLSLASDASCAAHVWLLTFGYTLTFATLFSKTFRIWSDDTQPENAWGVILHICVLGARKPRTADAACCLICDPLCRRIFTLSKLRMVKIRDRQLLLLVGAFLAVDILLNSIWAGVSGMRAVVVLPDPLRPALAYRACEYSDVGMAVVWAHLAVRTRGAHALCCDCMRVAHLICTGRSKSRRASATRELNTPCAPWGSSVRSGNAPPDASR